MKLDYIDDINEYGDNIVRLYEFDKSEAIKFRDIVLQTVLTNKNQLDLVTVEFIEPRNCNLILRISDTDEGIITDDSYNFRCNLTIEGFRQMMKLLEPFCNRETMGYQYLYDIDSLTDFLFSPGGTW